MAEPRTLPERTREEHEAALAQAISKNLRYKPQHQAALLRRYISAYSLNAAPVVWPDGTVTVVWQEDE